LFISNDLYALDLKALGSDFNFSSIKLIFLVVRATLFLYKFPRLFKNENFSEFTFIFSVKKI
jgi:hypothetical protein